MLAVVDLVVAYDGAAVGADLNARQGVAVDVVTLYQTPPISKYVDASLVPVEDGVPPANTSSGVKCCAALTRCCAGGCSPYGGVAVGRDPHTSKVVGVDFVLYELAATFLVDVDAPRLAVVDLAAHHRGVGVGLHLKARYTVPVDVTVLKVALQRRRERQEASPERPAAQLSCFTMPWSKVNTPTSRPWWMWLRLMMGFPWFFTQIPASALLLISLSS